MSDLRDECRNELLIGMLAKWLLSLLLIRCLNISCCQSKLDEYGWSSRERKWIERGSVMHCVQSRLVGRSTCSTFCNVKFPHSSVASFTTAKQRENTSNFENYSLAEEQP